MENIEEQKSSEKEEVGTLFIKSMPNHRERGVLYQKGDFVRDHHGIQNAKLIRHFSNEDRPPSMEKHKSIEKFG